MPKVYPYFVVHKLAQADTVFDTEGVASLQVAGIFAATHNTEDRGLHATSVSAHIEAIPNEPVRTISGTVQEGAAYVSRVVRVYRRRDGALLGETTSAPVTGAFLFKIVDKQEEVFILAFDDSGGVSYNAVVSDKVLPA